MDYIFQNKMKNSYDWNIPETTIKKMPELVGSPVKEV